MFFLYPLKNKYMLFKTTYPNINISVLCIICRSEISQSLTGFLKYLPKTWLFQSKDCGEKNPFPATLRREKDHLSTKPGGGGKGLNGLSLKKSNFFCGDPYPFKGGGFSKKIGGRQLYPCPPPRLFGIRCLLVLQNQ